MLEEPAESDAVVAWVGRQVAAEEDHIPISVGEAVGMAADIGDDCRELESMVVAVLAVVAENSVRTVQWGYFGYAPCQSPLVQSLEGLC
jgi:hypothetical protein